MRSDHAHFRSLNAAILKMQSEDWQTLERHNQLADAGQHRSERDEMEKKSNKIYGKDGRVEHESVRDARRAEKKAEKAASRKVKKPAVAESKLQSEDYQTPERARQTYATGQEGSKQDTDEKRSKKVYGKDGKVLYASLANLRRSLNKKSKKVAESVESAEYTELLESVLLALCEELELDPNELLTEITKKTYVNALQQYSDPQSERPQPKHDEDAIIARATREQGKKFGKNMERLASMGGGNYPRRDKQGAEKSDEPDQSTTYPSSPARITKGGKMNKTDTRVLKQRIKDRIKTLKKSNRKAK